MKPTLAMDEKPAATIIQTPELPYKWRQSHKGRWMAAGFSVLLALMAVILVFQVLSFRQLKETHAQTSKKDLPDKVETEVNYHIEENDETVNERVTVDDREEDVTTQKARMIFDYDRGIVVTKLTDDENTQDGVCYVATFNNSGSTDDLKEAYMNAEDNEEAHLDPDKEVYESTDETVPRDLLSPRAQQMCENSKIFLVKKSDKKVDDDEGELTKRACYLYQYVYCRYRWWSGWRCYVGYYVRCS